MGKTEKKRFEKSAPYSLDSIIKGTENEITYIDSIGNYDFNFEKIEVRMLVDMLPNKLKDIVSMIYIEGFSQTEIAKIIGCSQVSISRLRKEALEYLKFQVDYSIKKRWLKPPII